jgi:hypothetical protein
MPRFFDAGFAELQAIKSSRLKVQEFASFQSASKFVFENLQKISQVEVLHLSNGADFPVSLQYLTEAILVQRNTYIQRIYSV